MTCFGSSNEIRGGERVIVPIKNTHGICYYICAVNMIVDSEFLRKCIPKNHELSRIVRRGDFSVLATKPSGGDTKNVLAAYLDELDCKNVFLWGNSYILHSNAKSVREAIRRGIKNITHTGDVLFIQNENYEMECMYPDMSFFINDVEYVLSGIVYSTYESEESPQLIIPSQEPPNPDLKYPHNHVFYVSFDTYTDEWVMLSNNNEFILSSPVIYRDIEFVDYIKLATNGTYVWSTITDRFCSPWLFRYERQRKNYTKLKLSRSERFNPFRYDDLGKHIIGNKEYVVDAIDKDILNDEEIRNVLSI